MTIIDPQIIREMIENGGSYRGDPVAKRIYKYEDMSKESLFAVFFDDKHDDMHVSPYVVNPILLFEHGTPTSAGQEWLEKEKKYCLRIKTLPSTWIDSVEKLPHAMFQILTNFIELEKPDDHINWDSTPDHRQARDKMDELYEWWHNVYLKFDCMEGYDSSKTLSEEQRFTPIENDNDKEIRYKYNSNEYEKKFFEKANRLEMEMNEELNRRCKELIDIREFLWT